MSADAMAIRASEKETVSVLRVLRLPWTRETRLSDSNWRFLFSKAVKDASISGINSSIAFEMDVESADESWGVA